MSNRRIAKSSILEILVLIVVAVAGCGSSPNQGEWETKWKGKTGIKAFGDYGYLFVTTWHVDEKPTIHITDSFYENTECRITAIDNKGGIHTGTQSSKLFPERKYRSTEAVFPDLTLKKVKEFQFQTRPYKQKNR